MPHDVFISYSSKDKPIANAICANLENSMIRCWIAPRDIQPGDDWPTAITEAIAESRIMVLVFSANSNASEDVGRELMLAANSKLVIIPFKIEDVEPVPGKKYYLARTHWLDAINPPTQEQIDLLVSRVRAFLAVDEKPPHTEPVSEPDLPQATQDNDLSEQKPGPKPRKPRKIWVPIASFFTIALVLWVILTFITHTLPSPAVFSPENTPTATSLPPKATTTATASIPTATTAPVMMATQTEQVVQATEPEPTETSEPDWVVNFSNPILSYIADRPPTFQDDFESGTLDSWALFTSGHSNPLNPYVENGQIHVSREQTYPRGFQFDDYVIEVDAKFAETVTPNNLNISFRTNNCVFRIYSDSYVDAYCYENPGGDTKIGKLSMGIDDLSDGRLVHLTLIVKDTRFAFFVDGIPLGFIDHEYLDFGNAMLSAEVPYGIFDNFQVWDISDFYIP